MKNRQKHWKSISIKTDTLTDTLFCFRFLFCVFQNVIFVIKIRINAILAHFFVIDSRFPCWFEPNRGSQKKAHRITDALFLLYKEPQAMLVGKSSMSVEQEKWPF